jgi:antitoxin VapB
VQRLGKAVMLVLKDAAWQTFLAGLSSFSDDYMESDRNVDIPSGKDAL